MIREIGWDLFYFSGFHIREIARNLIRLPQAFFLLGYFAVAGLIMWWLWIRIRYLKATLRMLLDHSRPCFCLGQVATRWAEKLQAHWRCS